MNVKIGDLFESECTTIVNTINCVGVMGKGIALEYKKRYPEMFQDYIERCEKKEVKPGVPYVYSYKGGKNILNFPTKDHWKSPSRLSYVIDGLNWFVDHYKEYSIESIAFPPLGCGNGGLSWEVVGPIMYQKLSQLPIEVEIYAPFGTEQKEMTEEFLTKEIYKQEMVGNKAYKMNPKWYLILQVIKELNNRTYSLKVGRTIYQKICYVLTRNGIDTGFTFVKGTYGPFSQEAKESITVLANANLIVEKELGRMLSLSVADKVIIQEDRFSKDEWDAVHKTVDLFGRVKCTGQAEMVATVLYAYDELAKTKVNVSDKEVYDFVVGWKPYWKTEKEYEICDTIQNMAMLSLMRITYSGELMETEI